MFRRILSHRMGRGGFQAELDLGSVLHNRTSRACGPWSPGWQWGWPRAVCTPHRAAPSIWAEADPKLVEGGSCEPAGLDASESWTMGQRVADQRTNCQAPARRKPLWPGRGLL